MFKSILRFRAGKIKKMLVWILFFLYLVVVTKLILFKEQVGSVNYRYYNYGVLSFRQNLERANIVPFKTINSIIHGGTNSFIIQNIIGNIILFTPLGILLPIVIPFRRSFNKIFVIAFALSSIFELIQLTLVLGIFDIDDIILNTLGAIIGSKVYKQLSPKKNYNFQTFD